MATAAVERDCARLTQAEAIHIGGSPKESAASSCTGGDRDGGVRRSADRSSSVVPDPPSCDGDLTTPSGPLLDATNRRLRRERGRAPGPDPPVARAIARVSPTDDSLSRVQLSFRLGGADGVAVEARKWAWALGELGFEVRRVAGEIDDGRAPTTPCSRASRSTPPAGPPHATAGHAARGRARRAPIS